MLLAGRGRAASLTSRAVAETAKSLCPHDVQSTLSRGQRPRGVRRTFLCLGALNLADPAWGALSLGTAQMEFEGFGSQGLGIYKGQVL